MHAFNSLSGSSKNELIWSTEKTVDNLGRKLNALLVTEPQQSVMCVNQSNYTGDHLKYMSLCILFSPSKATDCGPLDNPKNGNVTLSDTIFRAEAVYACNEGHSLVGNNTRTCLTNGNWSGSEPECQRMYVFFRLTFIQLHLLSSSLHKN